VRLPFTDVSALAGGGNHTTHDADGTWYSCGGNQYGQLGDGLSTPAKQPFIILSRATAISSTAADAVASVGS
jgi:alpha-tubulin suppressor-like RCC1 family protein